MKKFFVVAIILFCAASAWSQPDNGPGLADVPKLAPVPVGRAEVFRPTPQQIAAEKRAAYGRLINPAEKLDLSSPESSVRSFIWALWNADLKTARQCVQGARPYEEMVEFEKRIQQDIKDNPRGETRLLVSDLHSYVTNFTATVSLRTLILDDGEFHGFSGSCERFYLRKVENNWMILPYVKESEAPILEDFPIPNDDVLAKIAVTLADANVLKTDQFSNCQSNLKQIALGIMQYVQDAEAKFDLGENWKDQIKIYVKSEEIFHCPDAKDKQETYAFNTELAQFNQAKMNLPEQLIMVYEGKDQQFEYRHRGQTITNIAFVDGHVKAFTTQSLATALKNGDVRWKP